MALLAARASPLFKGNVQFVVFIRTGASGDASEARGTRDGRTDDPDRLTAVATMPFAVRLRRRFQARRHIRTIVARVGLHVLVEVVAQRDWYKSRSHRRIIPGADPAAQDAASNLARGGQSF